MVIQPLPQRLAVARASRRRALSVLALSLSLVACAEGAAPGAPPPDPASPGAEVGGVAAPDASAGAPAFEDATEALGLDFVHDNGMTGRRWFVEMMSAGAGLLDYDGDGDLDLYLVQGGPIEGDGSLRPDGAPSDRLYRNELDPALGPDSLRFTDVTEAAGLSGTTGYGNGLATGDYDNDGDLDIYLVNWGPNQLWRNAGDGSFENVTEAAGAALADPGWSAGASFFDYDRDGWLDLMVVNYDAYDTSSHVDCHSPRSGRLDYCGPQSYPAQPDRLLHNRGDGTFEDVSAEAGILAAYGPALGVAAADLDGDGWQDLFVANDGAENQQWMNRAGARFEDMAPAMGSALSRDGMTQASMGVLAEDLDGDADIDLFLTHLERETNTLYLNDGTGFFQDESRSSGLGQASFAFTGFGVAALDYDNDGRLDIMVSNGEVRIIDEQAEAGDPLPLRQTKQLFRGLGEARFEEASAGAGEAFAVPAVGRGVAAGDLDNDGDTDLLLAHNGGPAWILRNRVGQDAAWLGLRLRGVAGRDVLGAQAALLVAGQPRGWRRAASDGSYGSARDPRILYGLGPGLLGAGETIEGLRVRWPDGGVEDFPAPAPGAYQDLFQDQGRPAVAP